MGLWNKLVESAYKMKNQAALVDDPEVSGAANGLADRILALGEQQVAQVGDSYGWGNPCGLKTARCGGGETSGLFTIVSDPAKEQINVCEACATHQFESKKWVRVEWSPFDQ